MLQQAKLGD